MIDERSEYTEYETQVLLESERVEETARGFDADGTIQKIEELCEAGQLPPEELDAAIESLYQRVLANASSADLIVENLIKRYKTEKNLVAKPQKLTYPDNIQFADWPAEVLFGSEFFDSAAYIYYAQAVLFTARALRYAEKIDRKVSDRCYDMFRGYDFEKSPSVKTGFDFKNNELVLQHV